MSALPELFDFINSINNKNYIFDGTKKKNYNQYMINKFFMHFPDTLYIANEMNSRELSDEQHYDFLFHVIDRKKRFTKWYKEEKNEILPSVMEYFGVNERKAMEYISIMTDDDIKTITKEIQSKKVVL